METLQKTILELSRIQTRILKIGNKEENWLYTNDYIQASRMIYDTIKKLEDLNKNE
jgi:hypothetical protein